MLLIAGRDEGEPATGGERSLYEEDMRKRERGVCTRRI
jgi:hypothetical protein